MISFSFRKSPPSSANAFFSPSFFFAFALDAARLFRLGVSLAAAGAAAVGYVAALPGRWSLGAGGASGLAWTVGGTVLLAAGCSAWNQAQERLPDARMKRTRNRPVAAGRLSPAGAYLAGAICLILAAAALLRAGTFEPGAEFFTAGRAGGTPQSALTPGVAAACLVPVAALIYNGVYTPLKKRTGFALLAGAAVGALPPALGWAAAGGAPGHPLPALLYGVFLLWQIPHYWLRVKRNSEEYRAAGFVLPPLTLPETTLAKILILWCCAFGAALFMAALFPVAQGAVSRLGLALAGFAAAGGALLAAGKGDRMPSAGRCQRIMDVSLAASMAFVFADRLM